MADPLTPDAIAQKTFRHRLRGYDPQDVAAFLEEVAGSVRDLTARSEALHDRLLELGNRDLTAEFDLISREVGKILQDARDAAEGMRKRAARDAEGLTEEAQSTAVDLRSDAWMAAEKLLQDSAKEAAAVVKAAERGALGIIGEAEREAHRRNNAARRESEETIRAAKLEAERVLMDARARSDELIQEAGRKVEAAQKRAADLEERRTEMLAELENARRTISNLEQEIEQRREALAGPSSEEVESSTVKVLTVTDRDAADVESGTVWAEGHEVVKIVRPPKRIVEPPPEPVDAEAMAAEVARLRSPARGNELPRGGAIEAPPDEVLPGEAVDLGETGPEAPAPEPTPEIDDLFSQLREVDSPPPEPAPPEVVEEAPESQASPPPSTGPEATTPLDLRDRLLLPVANRVLRMVKRDLTEAQNIALEELRTGAGDWEPNTAQLTGRLAGSFEELLRDGYGAGWAAAAEVTGADLAGDGDRIGDPAEWAGRFSGALTEAVSEALADAQREGQGPRQLAAGLSRIYRAWRTDEAERRVRDIASGAYHRGFVDGLEAAGHTASRWVVGGRRCTICREAGEAGAVPLGSAFEDAVTGPPAHQDCGCTLVPA